MTSPPKMTNRELVSNIPGLDVLYFMDVMMVIPNTYSYLDTLLPKENSFQLHLLSPSFFVRWITASHPMYIP